MTPAEDIAPPSEAENAPKERNLPPTERPGADAKENMLRMKHFFLCCCQNCFIGKGFLLRCCQNCSIRMRLAMQEFPKLALTKQLTLQSKGSPQGCTLNFIRVWMKKIERWQIIAGSTANG